MPTYQEQFPIGSRVVVRANQSEGTDHDWDGHAGMIVAHGTWIKVKMDKRRHGWRTDSPLLCGHNLILETATPSASHTNGEQK